MKPGHTDDTAPESAPQAVSCERVSAVLSRVGDKWSVLTVMLLRDGPLRFNELKRRIGGVSQRMLTFTLRGLERDGLVTRTVFPVSPPRVDYALTALGHSLREPVDALGRWAFAHVGAVEEARTVFDRKTAAAASSAGPGKIRHAGVRSGSMQNAATAGTPTAEDFA